MLCNAVHHSTTQRRGYAMLNALCKVPVSGTDQFSAHRADWHLGVQQPMLQILTGLSTTCTLVLPGQQHPSGNTHCYSRFKTFKPCMALSQCSNSAIGSATTTHTRTHVHTSLVHDQLVKSERRASQPTCCQLAAASLKFSGLWQAMDSCLALRGHPTKAETPLADPAPPAQLNTPNQPYCLCYIFSCSYVHTSACGSGSPTSSLAATTLISAKRTLAWHSVSLSQTSSQQQGHCEPFAGHRGIPMLQ